MLTHFVLVDDLSNEQPNASPSDKLSTMNHPLDLFQLYPDGLAHALPLEAASLGQSWIAAGNQTLPRIGFTAKFKETTFITESKLLLLRCVSGTHSTPMP